MKVNMPAFIHKLVSRFKRHPSDIIDEDGRETLELSALNSDPLLAPLDAALRDLGSARPSELSLPRATCPDEDVLWKYLSSNLKDKEKEAVDTHLSECDACCVIVAEAVRHQTKTAPVAMKSLLTSPPKIENLPSKAIQQTEPAPSSPVAAGKPFWRWGLGLTAPATALAGLLLYLWLAQPNVDMVVHWDSGHTVRSSSDMMSLKSGQTLISGTRLQAEIISHRDGYIYLYLWSDSQGGQFLFPVPDMPQGNRVSRGDHLMVPAKGTWVIDQAAGQEECLYLLYSAEPKDVRAEGEMVKELNVMRASLGAVEKRLSKHFSIEQKIVYHHE